jgi:hypothetical protein
MNMHRDALIMHTPSLRCWSSPYGGASGSSR